MPAKKGLTAFNGKFKLTGRMQQIVFSHELPIIMARTGNEAVAKAKKYVKSHAGKVFQDLIDVGEVELEPLKPVSDWFIKPKKSAKDSEA